MWIFGCILIELFTGRPVFPGKNEFEQIQYIMEVLDVPPMPLLQKATRAKLFFDEGKPKITCNSKGRTKYPGTKNPKDILIGAHVAFIDLIQQCLEWDYNKRIIPDEALLHDWMQDVEPLPSSRRRLKYQRTCSDTSFLKNSQRFGKLGNYRGTTKCIGKHLLH